MANVTEESKTSAGTSAARKQTDHTPPPILIENGSVIIETDRQFTHDTGGAAHHPHRHMLGPNRFLRGVKILNDSGVTIYVDDAADHSSIKIWWNSTHKARHSIAAGSDLQLTPPNRLSSE